MKAEIFAARAIALANAAAIDLGHATGSAEWTARAAFLTPITKAFGTDIGNEVAHIGVQVHGGMGYVEETGAAQYARDVRVTAIYEGTNGIQAMDLVARKLMDGGDAAYALLDEMQATIEAARDQMSDIAEPVWQSLESLREATDWMLKQSDLNDRFAGAQPFLRAGRVFWGPISICAPAWLRVAKVRARNWRGSTSVVCFLNISVAPCCASGGRGYLRVSPKNCWRADHGRHTTLEYPWPEPPEFGRAIEIAQGILWIRLPLPMALDHVNIYAWMTGMVDHC